MGYAEQVECLENMQAAAKRYRAMSKRSKVFPALTPEQWTGDAEGWGEALNDAGWAFISEWNNAFPDKPMPAVLFNNLKQLLRVAIRKYAVEVAKKAVKEGIEQ